MSLINKAMYETIELVEGVGDITETPSVVIDRIGNTMRFTEYDADGDIVSDKKYVEVIENE